MQQQIESRQLQPLVHDSRGLRLQLNCRPADPSSPDVLWAQRSRFLFQRSLQVLRELLWAGVDEAVGQVCNEGVAGVLCCHDLLAHGQRLQAGSGHHVAGAAIEKHLQVQGVAVGWALAVQNFHLWS